MLTTAPDLFQQAHLFFSSAGRSVLTVAASLFLAYLLFMGTVLVTSAVGSGLRALTSVARASVESARRSLPHMVREV